MQISEEMIQTMVEKEIKEQVEAKLKNIGRETLKGIYKEAMRSEVRHFLQVERIELRNELVEAIEYEKDSWKEAVTNRVSEELIRRIGNSFIEDGDDGYYD